MPATERSFSESPSAALYLDTDVLVSSLFTTEPHYQCCAAFIERLFRNGTTRLYVSSLSWMEYGHVITRESFRRTLPAGVIERFQLDRWSRQSVREAYMQHMLSAFGDILDQFEWAEVALTGAVRQEALRLMATYRLGSQDAVHLASAAAAGVHDFASLDANYRRVDDLQLWNDLIHMHLPTAN